MRIQRINSQNSNQNPSFEAFKVKSSIGALKIIYKEFAHDSSSIRKSVSPSGQKLINVTASAAQELKAIEKLEANGHICLHLRTQEKLSGREFDEFVRGEFPNIGSK